MTSPQDVRGIENLLIKLRRVPDSIMLRERVLALLAELADDEGKVRLTLELADIVRKGDPLAGLRIAHMAFQFDRSNIGALTAIAESLRRLGREEKAEQVSQEIDRLRSAAKRQGRDPDPESLAATVLLASPGESSEIRQDATEILSGDSYPTKQQFSLDDEDDATMALVIEGLTAPKEAKVAPLKPRPSDRQLAEAKKAGLKLIKDKSSGKEPPKRGKAEVARPVSDEDPLLAEVDSLMTKERFLAALILLRKSVMAEASMEFSLGAMSRFKVIWKELGLKEIQWRESDGLEILLRLLRKPQLPSLGGLVVASKA